MAVPDHLEGFAGRRDSVPAWSDTPQRPAARLGTRILIAGSVIAIAGALVVVVWMLRFAPPVPSVVARPLRSETATPGVSAEKEDARPTQAPSPKVPSVRARRATSPAVAPGAADAGARTATAPSVAAATPPVLAKPPVVPAEATNEVAPAPAAAAALYTASDADVTPPQPIRQQWLRELPAGSPREVVTVEVVVNKRGTVDSVRLNNTPRSVGESMLFTMSLHAIKSWEFRPALKDGNPVLYRQVMSFGGIANKPRPIQDPNRF
jgi:outer membrane biosynthesis protein TonB